MINLCKFSLGLILITHLCSCQKEVDIDLNSANPKIVVEAEISDELNFCEVKIQRSVNFNETNNFPPLTGAVVRISDDSGNSAILSETSSGIYTTTTMQGAVGKTYTLEITSDEKVFAAISKINHPTTIDTILLEESFFGKRKILRAEFKDSAGIDNYYRLLQEVNGTPKENVYITNDYLRDGETLSQVFFSRGKDSLVSGDQVTIFLQSIDKDAYEYFRTLNQLEGGGGQSSTPANPTSNLSQGALGYFSAYAVRSKTMVIP